MQPRGCIFSFTLTTAVGFGITAMAADLPKEGAANGTYSSYGTFKVIPIGKERLLFQFDENGFWLSDGFGDHLTSHCWGTGDYTGGMGQEQGYCVGTDPGGDQVVYTWTDEKHALGAKSVDASDTWVGGTGKFTGISGRGATGVCHSDFKAATEGTYFSSCTAKLNYKLP
jgi:hypothetical protein